MLLDLFEMLLPAAGKRRAKPLLERREVVTGRIDAIRVVDRIDPPDDWSYGVEVAGARYGFMQWLEPARGRASLGAEVVLRRLDGKVLIDWPASLAQLGFDGETLGASVQRWKPLEEPPPPGLTGVTEEQLGRRRG
jgi:hypothetical protein